MIMMPHSWRWLSLQFTGQADFWHPTGVARPVVDPDYTATIGLTREQARALVAAADPDAGPQAPRRGDGLRRQRGGPETVRHRMAQTPPRTRGHLPAGPARQAERSTPPVPHRVISRDSLTSKQRGAATAEPRRPPPLAVWDAGGQ